MLKLCCTPGDGLLLEGVKVGDVAGDWLLPASHTIIRAVTLHGE